MGLKRSMVTVLAVITVMSGSALAWELWRIRQAHAFNQAIVAGQYERAGKLGHDNGQFALAFAAHEAGRYQDARIIYAQLERSADLRLRVDALFNAANTYLQQASTIDGESAADLRSPLIELAKGGYRRVLALDSTHWNAKYNLERALDLLPDPRDQALMELDGLRGAVRAISSPDIEDELP